MSIQLITFDLDDTLWEVAPVLENAETALREWLLTHAPLIGAEDVERLWDIRSALVTAEPALRHRISELRRRVLQQALGEVGYADQDALRLAEQAFEVFLAARHRVSLFPEAQPTLETLANRYRLAVLTNGNADVRRLGLADYFQFALCAEDLGVGKPDPAPFREALRRAGVAAGQAVHVGDHPDDDILGAQAAGLRAIWYNPRGLPWAGDAPPDAQVRRLDQLPALLARWSARA